MTLIDIVKKSVRDFQAAPYGEDFDLYSWIQEFISEADGVTWPELKGWPEVDCDGELEDLDMENCEVFNVTKNELDICCGGDWQEPHRVIITYNPTQNILECTDKGEHGCYDGLNEEQFCEKLGFEFSAGDLFFPEEDEQKEITTEDCKEAIIEYLKKWRNQISIDSSEMFNKRDWARSSKKGTDPIVREFISRTTPLKVIVESTKYKILTINFLTII